MDRKSRLGVFGVMLLCALVSISAQPPPPAEDPSGISKNLGIEVSGFLGFSTFRQLEMKIDYRDRLVQFIYDPSKLPAALRP